MEREGCAILKIKELIRQVLTALLNVKPWPDTDLLKFFSEYNFPKNDNETQKKHISKYRAQYMPEHLVATLKYQYSILKLLTLFLATTAGDPVSTAYRCIVL